MPFSPMLLLLIFGQVEAMKVLKSSEDANFKTETYYLNLVEYFLLGHGVHLLNHLN